MASLGALAFFGTRGLMGDLLPVGTVRLACDLVGMARNPFGGAADSWPDGGGVDS